MTVVFFDGVCNLCNGFVDFLIRRDRRGTLRFASLQGETAAKLLPDPVRSGLSSVVLWRDGQLLRESNAALVAITLLGWPWKVLGALLVVPPPLRDFIYRWIADNRYTWFGKRETCRMPSPEEKDRLLP